MGARLPASFRCRKAPLPRLLSPLDRARVVNIRPLFETQLCLPSLSALPPTRLVIAHHLKAGTRSRRFCCCALQTGLNFVSL